MLNLSLVLARIHVQARQRDPQKPVKRRLASATLGNPHKNPALQQAAERTERTGSFGAEAAEPAEAEPGSLEDLEDAF